MKTMRSGAALAVAGVAVYLFGIMSAAALEPLGQLRIEFGATDQLRYVPESGPEIVVPFYNLRDATGSPRDDCTLAVGDYPDGRDTSLLAISGGDRSTVGFNVQKDWIGIREQKRGVDCGRVVAGQGLTIALGDDEALSGLMVTSAVLELSVKKNVVIDIAVSADGAAVEHYQLRTGFSVVSGEGQAPEGESGWTTLPGTEHIFNCRPRSDSGPDVDSSCRVAGLQGFWDTIELTTAPGNEGEWSLGSGTTVFQLTAVDGVLDCGETTIVAEDLASDGLVQLRRLDNIDGTACVAIPYTLSFGDQTVTFLADYLGQDESVAFEWMVTWAEEALVRPEADADEPLASALALIPVSIQQFRDVDPVFPLDLCVGTPQYEDGLLTGVVPPASGFPDMSPDQEVNGEPIEGLPGVQYGCLLTREIDYLGELDGNDAYERIQLRESGYLQGDWISSRSF
jgi:hypothetical protein